MAGIFSANTKRPNRLTEVKNIDYHKNMATYCLQTLNNHTYRRYIQKCLINWSFYKGGDGQWIFDEDVESFFLDESGDVRNRLKWTKNVIKPMVQQYVGNAIRLSYDAEAECISPFVINKREQDLKRIKGFEAISKQYPFFKNIIKENIPIGDTEVETIEIFENSFVEDYVTDINNMIEYVSTEINVNSIKEDLARNLALSGLAITKGFEFNDNFVGEATNPLFFGWDMSAKKSDLSDAEYMFEWYYSDAPSLFEKYPNLLKTQREAIESYGSEKNIQGIHKIINNVLVQEGGKVPVYEVYWKDYEKKEAGYVLDEFGYPYYTFINHENSDYTDSDLIEPPTEKGKKKFGNSKKITVYDSVIRTATIIAGAEINSSIGDIVLDYGILPYQEKYLRKPSESFFPYKVKAWVYDRGEVLTPMDDVIDPQRFLNRTLSVVESHMANMRGTGTVISKSAVDDRDGEADFLRNINASKPIFVDTDRVGSVQNAIGQYGTNIGGGTLQMFQVIREVQQSIQDVTGVNEAMTGTQGGSDVLVGVIEAQIQRGSLVQEPFYATLTSVLREFYEQIATTGKSIYVDNPRQLSIMVGDKGFVNINLTKEHLLQDYRIMIKRSETREQGIQAGNQLLFTLLQAGIIDQARFANLFDRSNSTMIAQSIREYQREKLQAQYEMDKVNAQRNQQMQGAMVAEQGVAQQQQQQAIDLQMEDKALTHEMDLEKTELQEGMKTERELAKAKMTQPPQ